MQTIPQQPGGGVPSEGLPSIEEECVAWTPHTGYVFRDDNTIFYKIIVGMVQYNFHFEFINHLKGL